MKADRIILRSLNSQASAVALGLLLSLAAVCALGCSIPFPARASSGESSASLTVSLSVPTARTIVASSADFGAAISTLSIAVVDSASTTVAQANGIGYSLGVTKTFGSLTPGDYTIKVDAFDSTAAKIASGSNPVTLSADATQSVTVSLSFSQSASTGGFSLDLQWPKSTGLAYVSATLDGTAMTDPVVTVGADYSATVAASGLVGGSHTLCLQFKTSSASATVYGLYVESVNIWDGVTSNCWLDSSGACVSTRVFASTDFFDTNVNLGDLIVQDGSATGAPLSTGFSSGTTIYDLYAIPSTKSIVFTPTESAVGQYITYSWNGGSATELASGAASATLAFNPDPAVYDNMLSITVRAPDGVTTKIYTLTWHGAAVTVGVSTATSYQALTFANYAPSVKRGNAIAITTNNLTLAALSSGWTWYVDGGAQTVTLPTLSLDAAATGALSVGQHFISATVTYNGVVYSGNLILTVEE